MLILIKNQNRITNFIDGSFSLLLGVAFFVPKPSFPGLV